MDVLAAPPPRRWRVSSDGAIVYCAVVVGLVVGVVLKLKLAEWDAADVRACIATGTASAYCHNTEAYPTVLQCAYALIAGWTSFFAAWVLFTMQPRSWVLL